MITKDTITDFLKDLQDNICQQLELADEQGKFQEDKWERPGGGGGRTRILQGQHIEKGGVNFSAVHGPMPKTIAAGLKLPENGEFFATGVSIVLHPRNPHVPIIHMNVRYFEMSNGQWWFGGGIDLTPHYVVEKEAQFFHQTLKKACDKNDMAYYPKFKQWADDYFYIKHRQETRGIGGIFYDRLGGQDGFTKADRFQFMQDVGNTFCKVYIPLLLQNKDQAFTDTEKEWQYIRRGRYVEFNLVWDRGTKFGLDTNGRTESILMSLPPHANWQYNHRPAAGTAEAKTLALLQKGIDWTV